MSNDELIDLYIDRFINQTEIWGRQWVSNRTGSYGYAYQKPNMDTQGGKYQYEPVTPSLVQRHLEGTISCAWAAIDTKESSKWICFDSDDDVGTLAQLDEFLRRYEWNTIREGKRPGREGHLWLLFDQRVPCNLLIVLGTAMAKLAGVNNLEIFPKCATGLSQVRGPLGINVKPEAHGCRGWFDGVEQDIQTQLRWLAAQQLNKSVDAIREAKKHAPKPTKITSSNNRRHYHSSKYKIKNILEHVDYKKVGKEYVARCPACAAVGQDNHKDNLRISLDGSKFCCVEGGPAQTHKARDIIQALLKA